MAAIILAVDDEACARLLAGQLGGHEVVIARDAPAGLDLLGTGRFDVVFADMDAPGGGLAILRAARARARGPEVVLTSGRPAVAQAVEAMREGAHDYLPMPCAAADALAAVASAMRCRGCEARRAGVCQGPHHQPRSAGRPPEIPFRDFVEAECDRLSAHYLVALLSAFRGNVTSAARHAGMQRISLLRLLKRHGLAAAAFRRTA